MAGCIVGIVGVGTAPVGGISTVVARGSASIGTLPSVRSGHVVVTAAVTVASVLTMSALVTSGATKYCASFKKGSKIYIDEDSDYIGRGKSVDVAMSKLRCHVTGLIAASSTTVVFISMSMSGYLDVGHSFEDIIVW